MTKQLTVTASGQQSDPLAGIDIPHTTYRLPNGLTLIVAENQDTPLVSVNMIYLVGSKDEPAGKTGFAHLFEHLMFEGSENAPGAFVENMTRAGASDINAFTGPDRTTYHCTVPVGSLDYALFMESDRMGHFCACINQQSLDQQRRVVLNEKLETSSGPYGKVYETAVKGTFPPGHPYAHTVIGEAEDIESATLEDVRQWFSRWYTPSNAVLTLSGAITPSQALEKVTRWFGDFPAGAPLIRPRSWIPAIPESRSDSYQARVPDPTIMLYWNIPAFGTTDSVRLSMIADIFTGSVGGQLIRRLVYEAAVVSDITVSVSPGVLCSQLIISATVTEGQDPQQVRQLILQQIDEFIEQGTDDDTLLQVRQDALNFFSESYRTSAQVAGLLSSSFAQWERADGYLDIYRTYQQTTVADLQQTARRWLAANHYVLNIMPFSDQPPTENAEVNDRRAPAVLAPESAKLPETQIAQLDNGITVQLAERHSHADIFLELLVPKTAMKWPGEAGLLTELLNMSGTTEQDTFAFDRSLRAAGVRLQVRQRLHHISVTVSCRTAQLEQALQLLQQRLSGSVLTEQDVSRQLQQLSSGLTTQQEMPAALSLRVLPAIMYPAGHPCRVPLGIESTRQGLQAVTFAELNAAVPELLNLADATLVISGDTTPEALLPVLNRTLGSMVKGERRKPLSPQPRVAEKPRLYIIDIPGAQQSSLVAASLVPGNRRTDEAGFDLLNDIFANGFTSRLNLNLREDKNWTYGVKCGLINDPDYRVHYIQAEIQTDKTVEAFAELLAEYRNIAGAGPVTESELEQVRTTSLLATAGWGETLESLNNMHAYLLRNQLAGDFWTRYQQQLRTVSLKEINHLAADIFNPQSLSWVIAGDSTAFSDSLVKLFGDEVIFITDGGESFYAVE